VLKVHWSTLLTKSADTFKRIESALKQSGNSIAQYFLRDPFLTRLLVNFVFCTSVLKRHQSFGKADSKASHYVPSMAPAISDALADASWMSEGVSQLAEIINATHLYEL
jgi:hypothetical protein